MPPFSFRCTVIQCGIPAVKVQPQLPATRSSWCISVRKRRMNAVAAVVVVVNGLVWEMAPALMPTLSAPAGRCPLWPPTTMIAAVNPSPNRFVHYPSHSVYCNAINGRFLI